MTPTGDMVDIVQRGLGLPWGVSCVHFSYEKSGATLVTGEFFKQRKIPMVFIVCHFASMGGQDESRIPSDSYSLDNICIKGIERK